VQGKISKYLVSHGGSAVLAETDELIGGETYVVENSRDFATAQAFVAMVERFKASPAAILLRRRARH
jgi:altronate dehydratase